MSRRDRTSEKIWKIVFVTNEIIYLYVLISRQEKMEKLNKNHLKFTAF